MQLTHYTSKFSPKRFPITLVCDTISNAANVGSLFRTADAFGAENIVFCGAQTAFGRKMTKTSRATEKYVPFETQTDVLKTVSSLKEKGYFVVALEITSNSKPLQNTNFNGNQPIALVVGAENFGIANEVLEQVDAIVHINMFGNNSSMNVVQATSIALYEITNQLTAAV
ncbi:TrmH family RNA methyltransferase [Bizionia sediminis]|uniref:TrmH family RNA methyltransferase n=1 Tax=Bizionia sediminis TaxID=1737064 RepID=A0ABW5KQD3_9FLAO